jgi:outer membrane biosynthesis protein TonB
MRIGHAGLSLLLLSVGAATAGCFHASAKTVSDSPPLEMPPPPPRIVEAVEVTPPPLPLPLVEEPARQPVRPPPSPAPRAADAPPPPKPEPAKVEPPPPVVEPPRVAEEAPKPATTLQMTRAEQEVESAIRRAMTRATADLKRVNLRGLNADARTQYDTAKRLVEQAEDALKKHNLVFAQGLAEKAQGLAAQLAGR